MNDGITAAAGRYLLSVIDVYSRKILDWVFQGSIRQMDLINLLRRVNQGYELKGVILRNDNGSQFIAHSVRKFLKNSEVKQEFTHVATPEENSYIDRAAGAGLSQHSRARHH
ncbi:transposase family protein [Spirosoma aureum]|uniref:Transposase family protein n=1 Tax=Spirosoma aureum TaxID=2692134 RepID=A0A6G9AN11_9BACT|nr:transposase family protein [Spirosoma aureum]QIP16496.1 transposase family protein [Spirosoma aureum]